VIPKLYQIIKFKQNCGSCGGSLVQFQQGDEPKNALPFSIGKVLVSSDMNPDDVRGNHAHHETEEIVVALNGGCTFELDDGLGTSERVRLSASDIGDQRSEIRRRRSEYGDQGAGISVLTSEKEALLLYPHIWRTFYDFEPRTVLLIVANITYDEIDYIRDRSDFERLAKEWTDLGGSSAHCEVP